MSGMVRDIEPVTLRELWSRKTSLQHSLDIISHNIIRHEQAQADERRKLARVRNELRVITQAIKRKIQEADNETRH